MKKSEMTFEDATEIIDVALNNPCPIHMTNKDGLTHDCYMDMRRQLIFPNWITTELARELGWKWEIKE